MNVSQWTLQDWVAVVMTIAAFVGLLIRGERRVGGCMTRKEHDAICERRNQEQSEKFDVIRADIRELREWLMSK